MTKREAIAELTGLFSRVQILADAMDEAPWNDECHAGCSYADCLENAADDIHDILKSLEDATDA